MKTIKNIVVIVASCLLMWSCAEDVLVDAEETVTEGEPVKISLQLDRSQMITRAGLSPTQEKAIHSVFVLVFNSGGTKVSQTYLDSNITAGLSNIQTVSGNGMSIYVIANLSPENTGYTPVKDALDHVYTLSSLNSPKPPMLWCRVRVLIMPIRPRPKPGSIPHWLSTTCLLPPSMPFCICTKIVEAGGLRARPQIPIRRIKHSTHRPMPPQLRLEDIIKPLLPIRLRW